MELIEKEKSATISSKILGIPIDNLIELRPLPPSGYSIDIDFLYISMPRQLLVTPRTQIITTIDIPIDIGIYIDNNLIHKTSPSTIKYALYGPPNTGVLCRYIDSNIVASTPKDYLGIMRISIENSHEDVVNVNKVVIPIKGLAICLSNEMRPIYNMVYINISDENYAEVYTDASPSSDDDKTRCFNNITEAEYIMVYGL